MRFASCVVLSLVLLALPARGAEDASIVTEAITFQPTFAPVKQGAVPFDRLRLASYSVDGPPDALAVYAHMETFPLMGLGLGGLLFVAGTAADDKGLAATGGAILGLSPTFPMRGVGVTSGLGPHCNAGEEVCWGLGIHFDLLGGLGQANGEAVAYVPSIFTYGLSAAAWRHWHEAEVTAGLRAVVGRGLGLAINLQETELEVFKKLAGPDHFQLYGAVGYEAFWGHDSFGASTGFVVAPKFTVGFNWPYEHWLD